MNDFFEQEWLHNPVRNYFIIGLIIFFVWALRRFISRYLAGLLYNLVHRVWKDVDKKSFTNLVIRPLGFFLLILVSVISLHKLNFPEQLNVGIYKYSLKQIVHAVATIVLIVSFIGLLIRIIDFIAMILEKRADLTSDQSDNQLIVFFKDFFKVLLVVVGIMLVIKFAFDLNIGSLLTGLSIVGAAIALALRESIENLIASFIIFFDKPFTTGDLVKAHNVTGSVERIGLRSTRIRTDQKTFVTVPNKQMVDSILDNLSLRTQRRADIRLELGIRSAPDKLEELVKGLQQLIDRPEVEEGSINISEISSQAIIIMGDYYTAPITIREFNQLKQEISLATLRLLEKLGLELASANTHIRIEQNEQVTRPIV